MANPDAPFGLNPIAYKSGAPYNGAANPYYINASYATALFVGDPIVKVAGGSNAAVIPGVPGMGDFLIGTLPEIQKSGSATGTLTGVIIGFGADPDNLSLQYRPASTERLAWVADDPFLLFEIQADDTGDVTATKIGLNANFDFSHTGSAITGLSGAELAVNTMATTSTHLLKVIRSVNEIKNDITSPSSRLLVMLNQHTDLQNTAGI